MQRKYGIVLAAIIIALVAFSIVNTSYPGDREDGVRVQVYVYKNGRLVYYDPNDPATDNFLKLLYWLFATGSDDNSKLVVWNGNNYDPESSTIYQRDTGKGILGISSDNIAFSRDLNKFANYLWTSGLTISVDYNRMTITISGTINVNSNYTVNFVYLGTLIKEGGSYDSTMVLLFADKLSSPIQLNAGDSVTVVYKITLP